MASSYREYLNARDFIKEARDNVHNYKAIMTQTRLRYDGLQQTGIKCRAFLGGTGDAETIVVTNKCWRHVFEHPLKRRTPAERLARALTFPSALKLLEKTTTYQEVSISKGRFGQRPFYEFGIIGYVRGNRIKVVLRQDVRHTKKQKILYSFYQLSSAPREQQRRALGLKPERAA